MKIKGIAMNSSQRQTKWLTPNDIYLTFGITKQTQAIYRSKKKIPYSKIGKKVYYSAKEIDQWLKNAKVV